MQHQIYFHFRRELLKTIVECEHCKIIVTHGTDTIIETAKYLQIQLQEDSKMFEKRIILTGNLSKGIDNCFGVWHRHQNHGLRTPNEGINQRYLKNWTDVANKICFGRT